MKKNFLFLYIVFLINTVFCQVEIYRNKTDTSSTSLNSADTAYIPPKFPLNNGDFITYLNEEFNFNILGNSIDINGLNFRFSFQIDKKGNVEDFNIYSVASTEINREFDRIINKMPQWTPAKKGDKNIKTTLNYDLNIEYQEVNQQFKIKKNSLYVDNSPSHKALKWFLVGGAVLIFLGLLALKS